MQLYETAISIFGLENFKIFVFKNIFSTIFFRADAIDTVSDKRFEKFD